MSSSQTQIMPDVLPPDALPARSRDPRIRLVLRAAQAIHKGTLTVVLPDGSTHRVSRTPEPSATVVLRDPRAITRLLVGGSLGLAEAYLDGLWESPDIRDVMRVASANEAEWERMLLGRPWVRAFSRLAHALRRNTRKGAARNITEHYDLGNDFYTLWLDESMTYSSAMFGAGDEPLCVAQERKMRHLCEMLQLAPGMSVLEIGCGWGGFAEFAAREYGVRVTGITLSPSQLAYAQARIGKAGLAHRVELRLQDYRDVPGTFDRIASIEMFEAVGEKFWPTFFSVVHDRLNPGGRAGIQTIAIADRLFADYRGTADFIQRHVFPGGMLPCPRRLKEEIARAGLHWDKEAWFGQDYAETLSRWRKAFDSAWPRVLHLGRGHDARFKRLWDYYLAYCETGFDAGWTDVGQILLARP